MPGVDPKKSTPGRYLLCKLTIIFHHGPECGQGAADHVIGHTVAQPEVARAAEAVSGDYQQIVRKFCLFGKCHGVASGSLYEQIESTVRLGALIAHFPQTVIQQVAVLVISLQVRLLLGAQTNHLLHQRGRAHMAHGAGCTGHGCIDGGAVFRKGRDIYIANAFAGQGQGLGVITFNPSVLNKFAVLWVPLPPRITRQSSFNL